MDGQGWIIYTNSRETRASARTKEKNPLRSSPSLLSAFSPLCQGLCSPGNQREGRQERDGTVTAGLWQHRGGRLCTGTDKVSMKNSLEPEHTMALFSLQKGAGKAGKTQSLMMGFLLS